MGNFDDEMELLSCFASHCSTVTVCCEFGGVVCRPLGQFRSPQDYHYQTMRSNVELVDPLQIALTLSDAEGRLSLTWQFNMKFNAESTMFQNEILEALIKTGANVAQMDAQGVPGEALGAALVECGLLGKRWVSRHAGYDLGYVLQTLFGSLPAGIEGFREKLGLVAKEVVDLKTNQGQQNLNQSGVQAGAQSQQALVSFLALGGNYVPDVVFGLTN